jgi:hypothetical protein
VSDLTVTVRANGPYEVVGPVRIVYPDGRELELPQGNAIVLRRCRHSSALRASPRRAPLARPTF